MSGAAFDADVVVAGLGPVGAVVAGLLARTGLGVVAIEPSPDVYPLPRAAHIDHEVMRVFQQLGIADAIRPSTRVAAAYEFRSASGGVLLRFDPDPAGSPSGWSGGYMIHQPGIERALRAAITRAGVIVSLGKSVESVSENGDGVDVLMSDGGRVRARYVVACDGASSAVRGSVGIALEDLCFDEPWLVIDALVDAPHLLPAVNLQICDPARPMTCVQMPAGRHRWEFMLLPGESPDEVAKDAFIARLLAPWGVEGHVEVERRAVYRFHGLVARDWRKGRVLLAGDAAHQMPPFAGQGLCSGVRDAANLAWKLAAVIAGHADAAILDSYQTERGPHVRAYVDLAIAMGRAVCTLDPAAAMARDTAMIAQRNASGNSPPRRPAPALGPGLHLAGTPAAGTLFPQPWSPEGEPAARLDDILGEGAWLITRTPHTAPILAPGLVAHDLASRSLEPFRAALESWLAERGVAAVLVRPDRYVFGSGPPPMLADAYACALAGHPPVAAAA